MIREDGGGKREVVKRREEGGRRDEGERMMGRAEKPKGSSREAPREQRRCRARSPKDVA